MNGIVFIVSGKKLHVLKQVSLNKIEIELFDWYCH